MSVFRIGDKVRCIITVEPDQVIIATITIGERQYIAFSPGESAVTFFPARDYELAPPDIEVGDEVIFAPGTGASILRVIAIHGDHAWVFPIKGRLDGKPDAPYTVRTASLERV